MNSLQKYQLTMKLLATAAIFVQAYVFGPSFGMGICHGLFMYCIWFNKKA